MGLKLSVEVINKIRSDQNTTQTHTQCEPVYSQIAPNPIRKQKLLHQAGD